MTTDTNDIGGGQGGSLDRLKLRHPIPEFDDHVRFAEHIFVDEFSRPLWHLGVTEQHKRQLDDCGSAVRDWRCDRLENVRLLDAGAVRLLGHKYFVDGRLMDGSMTGFVHDQFEPFVEADKAREIANGDAIISSRGYGYYRIGMASLFERRAQLWSELFGDEGKSALEVQREFDRLAQELHDSKGDVDQMSARAATFLRRYRKHALRAILDDWRDARERGTFMHESIEMSLNDMQDAKDARFRDRDFQLYEQFRERWLRPRGLVPYRTELCLFDEGAELCGMIDGVFIRAEDLANPARQRHVVLLDWKRSKKIRTKAFTEGSVGKGILRDLPDCNHSHYTCQLNGYKWIMERNGFTVTQMGIAVFFPKQSDFEYYEIDDRQREISACIDERRSRKLADALHSKKRLWGELPPALESSSDAASAAWMRQMRAADEKLAPLANAAAQHFHKRYKQADVPSAFRTASNGRIFLDGK